jgi:hypothetical protein
MLTELALAFAGSAAVTIVLLVSARYCWRRGKKLEEP